MFGYLTIHHVHPEKQKKLSTTVSKLEGQTHK